VRQSGPPFFSQCEPLPLFPITLLAAFPWAVPPRFPCSPIPLFPLPPHPDIFLEVVREAPVSVRTSPLSVPSPVQAVSSCLVPRTTAPRLNRESAPPDSFPPLSRRCVAPRPFPNFKPAPGDTAILCSSLSRIEHLTAAFREVYLYLARPEFAPFFPFFSHSF